MADQAAQAVRDHRALKVITAVPTRLVNLVIDAADPARLARFWAAALGWEVTAEEPDAALVGPRGSGDPDPGVLPLLFLRVPEAKSGKNRVHLDLASSSALDQAAQVERLLGLGAVPGGIPSTVT